MGNIKIPPILLCCSFVLILLAVPMGCQPTGGSTTRNTWEREPLEQPWWVEDEEVEGGRKEPVEGDVGPDWLSDLANRYHHSE